MRHEDGCGAHSVVPANPPLINTWGRPCKCHAAICRNFSRVSWPRWEESILCPQDQSPFTRTLCSRLVKKITGHQLDGPTDWAGRCQQLREVGPKGEAGWTDEPSLLITTPSWSWQLQVIHLSKPQPTKSGEQARRHSLISIIEMKSPLATAASSGVALEGVTRRGPIASGAVRLDAPCPQVHYRACFGRAEGGHM